jgi:hypothetical protein|tara:strand:- start:864 stop:1034 length:171 start_codon:yes stop_codon:yes gene_type:complete
MEIIIDNKPVEIEPNERILMELINGRPPANESEKELVLELEQMEKEGFTPYIPSNL